MAVKKLDYDGLQTLVTVIEDYIKKHAGMPVGHEYFSVNPNIPEGSLPLFGGEYSRETYSDLWEWVQTQTGYLKTEAEWQTLSTSNNGNVPFYSDGDGSTTFRVPSLKCWVKSANGTINEVGSYLQAGLPNITGAATSNYLVGYSTQYSGAIKQLENDGGKYGTNTSTNWGYGLVFDASRSNSIYGNSNTVQPQSIVGLWLVKAYGTVIETGSIDEKQYIDDRMVSMKTYVENRFTPIFNKLDIITESCTYSAPATGWYKITIKGGGGGGGPSYKYNSTLFTGGGGGEGGTSILYKKLSVGDAVTINIGAGGIGGEPPTTATGIDGGHGGTTSITINGNTYSAYGGNGGKGGFANPDGGKGGSGTIPGAPGGSGSPRVDTNSFLTGGIGGGNGGAQGVFSSYGSNAYANSGCGGSGAGIYYNGSTNRGGNGASGYVWFEYFDQSL